MSKGDKIANLAQALTAYRSLMAAGFAPLCPQLTFFLEPFVQADHGQWLAVDLPWVRVSDAVLRLPGESIGGDLETVEARAAGIPVFNNLGDLCSYFGK